MKVTKIEGIKLLEILKLPTIERLDIAKIITGEINIENGISVRVSPKKRSSRWNVYLPSIHNCKRKEEVGRFVQENSLYDVFAHITVKPELIGSISRIGENDLVVIETYQNFEQRKREVVKNRMIIPIYGGRLWISRLELLKENPEDFQNFKKVIMYLKDIPFARYDMEYVIQKGEVIFTDLTLPDDKEYSILNDDKTQRKQIR